MFRVLSDPAIYEFENVPPPSEAWLAQRYQGLESRVSPDGREVWLNWVVRLPGGDLAGYVQATVLPTRTALIAYELGSRYWRQGIGSSAVAAVMQELVAQHGVRLVAAILKARNFRSEALLRRVGFVVARDDEASAFGPEADEIVMLREATTGECPAGRQQGR